VEAEGQRDLGPRHERAPPNRRRKTRLRSRQPWTWIEQNHRIQGMEYAVVQASIEMFGIQRFDSALDTASVESIIQGIALQVLPRPSLRASYDVQETGSDMREGRGVLTFRGWDASTVTVHVRAVCSVGIISTRDSRTSTVSVCPWSASWLWDSSYHVYNRCALLTLVIMA